MIKVGIIVKIDNAQSKPKDQLVLPTKNNDIAKNNLE